MVIELYKESHSSFTVKTEKLGSISQLLNEFNRKLHYIYIPSYQMSQYLIQNWKEKSTSENIAYHHSWGSHIWGITLKFSKGNHNTKKILAHIINSLHDE